MCERYFAGKSVRAATEQSDPAGAVVRSAERPCLQQTVTADRLAGHRIDLAGLYRLLGLHRRQDGRKAARHQSLAAARTPDKNYIVASSRSNLEAAAGMLPPDHLEIRSPGLFLRRIRILPAAVHKQITAIISPEDPQHISKVPHAIKIHPLDVHRLLGRFVWQHAARKAVVAGIHSYWKSARHIPYRAVKRKLSQEHVVLQPCRLHLRRSADQRNCYGQVERRPLLLYVRRGEIYYYSLPGDIISITPYSRKHAGQALLDRAVRQADQLDADSPRDVGFYRNRNYCQTQTGCTISLAKHVVFLLPS